MNRIKVYVAGPYTAGDVGVNVHTAIAEGDKLWQMGYAPFIPHLTHFWHLNHPRPYGEWLDYDTNWLLSCDVVYRMPGYSKGADEEVRTAGLSNIPVVTSVEELIRRFPVDSKVKE